MGPTAKFVGPTDCAQAQAVARLLPLNLVNQLGRGTVVCLRSSINKAAKGRWIGLTLLGWLLLFPFRTCEAQLTSAADPYTSEFEKSAPVDFYYQEKLKEAATVRQEQFRKRLSIKDAVGDDVPLAFPQTPAGGEKETAGVTPESDARRIVRLGFLLICLLLLMAILIVRLLAPEFFKALLRKINLWAVEEQPALSSAKVRAEEEAFGEFLASFQTGLGASSANAGVVAKEQRGAGDDFADQTARLLTTHRSLLQKIDGAVNDAARRRLLADLRQALRSFKDLVGAPELLPAWQLTSALEGLLKQLSDKTSNVTRSTLRTVGGAVDLLGELCQPGVPKDFLTDPALKFLVVDDDMISRTAVSFALKKTFSQPDLADNGTMALSLATRHAYDVIFLDVQMQGMDGFELCSRIHETPVNQHTPVVFVTSMSDFDARARAVLTGGTDLLGKPFLTFEITVKALTLALGRRLHSSAKALTAHDVVENSNSAMLGVDAKDEAASALESPTATDQTGSTESLAESFATTDEQASAMLDSINNAELSDEAPTDDIESAFLTRATPQLEVLRDHLRNLTEATGAETRQETLAEMYLGLHALTPHIDSTASHPAMRMCAALEGLIKKLLETPQNWASSTLLTLTNAVDLMDDLCAPSVNPELATNPPIQMLVVDDDLVSRRAIVGALQVAFEKPESAENGAEAVARATEKKFDLIFLDVQMPVMDGFTACEKIRQTQVNGTAPVVFVTSQSDFNTRAHVATSGGNGLIVKPFLTAEVTLKALTFALQGRLQGNVPQLPELARPQKATRKPESRRARKRRLARQSVN